MVEQPLAAALVLVGGRILGAIAFLGLLWLVTVVDRWYYNVFRHPGRDTGKPRREKTLYQRVMTARFERVTRDTNADVIVFGHTHQPEICSTRSGTQQVNCGSWIKQDDRYDTFVYIDENGSGLFQWLDNRREVVESRSRGEC
ncbi:MAG: hypothetical protein ACXVIF_03630 [Halobacteriota archaeon]